MSEWIVRVEAVNFSATIFDTNDLSTSRGGGLAALNLKDEVEAARPELWRPWQLLYSGASQCAFRITADGDGEKITEEVRSAVKEHMRSNPDSPHTYMMHVVDIAAVSDGNEVRALAIAEARNRTHQFRQWTEIPIAFSAEATDACPIDRKRPATVPTFFPKGKVFVPDEDTDAHRPDADLVRVSPAVKARRIYGRTRRQKFYSDILAKTLHPALCGLKPQFLFAQGFEDIVTEPPAEAGPSVKTKIAVVYADGNGFGNAVAALGPRAFSDKLDPLRKNLLKATTDWLADGARNATWEPAFAVRYADRRRLRFETILWGGDELAFVMPAWLATAFVEGFFRHTAGWTIGNERGGTSFPLSHAVGVAIGHVKTPIRQLHHIAKEAANSAKDAGLRGCNSVTFEIFESLHPPDKDLASWRRSLFGNKAGGNDLARKLALPGDDFTDVLNRLDAIKHGIDTVARSQEPFPRSQLYAALRKLRENSVGLGEAGADAMVDAEVGTYVGRVGMEKRLDAGALCLPTVDGKDRGLAMNVALTAMLWDYANVFGADFPRFAPVSALRS